MSEEEKPHDSAFVYSSTKGKHWYAGFISLQERESGKAEFFIVALLLIFAVFGGSFAGYIVQTHAINPPAQVLGICEPPAYIAGNSCLVQTTNSQNKNVTVNGGYIEGNLNCVSQGCGVTPKG